MQTMHLDYDMEITIVSPIKRLRLFNTEEIEDMALVYLLLGFTGLTGMEIARDEFAKLETPRRKTSGKRKTSNSSSCKTAAEKVA